MGFDCPSCGLWYNSTGSRSGALTLDKTRNRILELEQRLQTWEERYGCSYDLFAYRTATDEEYVKQLDVDAATQQWEGDLISWEFDVEELREWRRRLQRLLAE